MTELTAAATPDGYYVTTQQTGWTGRSRWGYVVHIPGHWPFVSSYRFGSEATARRAGDRDLAEYLDAVAAGTIEP